MYKELEYYNKMGTLSSIGKVQQLQQYLKWLNSFSQSNVNISWLILKYIPVLPPDIRPFSLIQSIISVHSINYLYSELVNINYKLYNLYFTSVSEDFLKRQKNLLQKKVDDLFLNPSKNDL